MTYDFLDDLLSDRENAIDIIKDSFEEYLQKKANEIRYSKYAENYLGNEMPSYFLKNDKPYLRNKPKKGSWIAYEYNSAGKVNKIAIYELINNMEICDVTYYFFEKDGFTYAVPFIGTTNEIYPSYTFKYKYINGMISFVSYIDKSGLWLELYRWDEKLCEIWSYVPKRNGSDLNAPIGTDKSPAHMKMEQLTLKNEVFSEKVYKIWLKKEFEVIKENSNIYICITENFRYEYSVNIIIGEKNTSDSYTFYCEEEWELILKKLTMCSKEILKREIIDKTIYIGFIDGAFSKL